MKGVRPVLREEGPVSASSAGPGSEKRTRFLVLCGVAGGVFIPLLFRAGGSELEQAMGSGWETERVL